MRLVDGVDNLSHTPLVERGNKVNRDESSIVVSFIVAQVDVTIGGNSGLEDTVREAVSLQAGGVDDGEDGGEGFVVVHIFIIVEGTDSLQAYRQKSHMLDNYFMLLVSNKTPGGKLPTGNLATNTDNPNVVSVLTIVSKTPCLVKVHHLNVSGFIHYQEVGVKDILIFVANVNTAGVVFGVGLFECRDVDRHHGEMSLNLRRGTDKATHRCLIGTRRNVHRQKHHDDDRETQHGVHQLVHDAMLSNLRVFVNSFSYVETLFTPGSPC